MVKKLLDIRLGEKLRMLRKLRRLTQKKLAEKIGISFQQLQKNEKGDNQISCSRLTKLAKALDVSVDYFFSELEEGKEPQEDVMSFQSTVETMKHIVSDDSLKLIGAYESLENSKLKGIIKELIDLLVENQNKYS